MELPHPPRLSSGALAARRQLAGRSWQVWQVWQVWVLLALMLAFQGLGQSHRVLHSTGFARTLVPLTSLAPLPPSEAFSALKAAALAPADGWGHQRGELICLLLDQFAHEQAPLTLPALAVQEARFATPGLALPAVLHVAARWKRAARGPPPVV